MTIRDYVEGRGKRAYKLTVGSLISMILVWVVWASFSKRAPDAKIVIPIGMLLVLFAVIAYLHRTKCPRCSKSLSAIAARAMSKGAVERANACPHCGVSFDDPVHGPPIDPVLDQVMTIRKYVESRAKKVSWAVYVAIPAAFYAYFAPKGSATFAAIAICVTSIGGAAIFINRTPCPKCGHPLGLVATRIGSSRSNDTEQCPKCGTKVDAPLDVTAR
jgi:transcription elongation factor Elf1